MGKRIHWAFDGSLAWWMSTAWTRTAIPAGTMSFLDADEFSSVDSISSSNSYLLFNFPGPITIDKIKMKKEEATTDIVFEVSSDSTDGQDGTWTEVLTASYPASDTFQAFEPTALSATWLRIYLPGYKRLNLCHLFGEYDSPRFEFWNAAGTAELTAEYPLAMANAPNLDDYAGNAQFKLKNTDGVQHDYSLTVKAVRYGGDSTITNNYSLSVDGGQTKLATVAVTGLAAGALSGVIDVYGDVLKAFNPADGYHYFVIDVTETA